MPELGGETRELTVLFSDIIGFTGISERLPPEHLVSLLNQYFEVITDIVEAHDGFVDKYIGDAIVAIFGAPIAVERHAEKAVRAALECRKAIADFNAPWLGSTQITLASRIGINTGEALIGNIGSPRRLSYTVIGDAVNLAARLEGTNKSYDTNILVSNTTQTRARSTIAFREIDLIRVVGRVQPVTIFEPLGLTEQLSDTARERISKFEAALALYRAGGFSEARKAFEDLAEGDGPAKVFASRCAEFERVQPGSDWSGIFDIASK